MAKSKRPEGERIEVRITERFKERLAADAAKASVSMSDILVQNACESLGFPIEKALLPKLLPGRKPSRK